MGLRRLTLLREPIYVRELAESIPDRYRWRAAFPSTVVMLPANGVERQCRWLLFHHWNTCWNASIDVPPATGELVHSFGLKYQTGGHELNRTMPRKYFQERPDFFPIVRGKRTAELGDFAYGNPEVEEIVRREAAAIFRRHRDTEGLHLWYDDVFFGAEDETGPPSWSPTRRAAEELRLVSGIHGNIAPRQRLITLAYNRQLIPDRKAHFDPNVDVLFCPRERCQIHPLDGCECNREYLELLTGWVDWLGPQRMLYLDYSLDHFIRVSTWVRAAYRRRAGGGHANVGQNGFGIASHPVFLRFQRRGMRPGHLRAHARGGAARPV